MSNEESRRTHCLSPLIFDKLLAGENEDLEEARKHTESCEKCKNRLQVLKEEQARALNDLSVKKGVDSLMAMVDPKQIERASLSPPARLRQYRFGAIATAAAAAAAVALMLVVGLPGQRRGLQDSPFQRDEPAVRLKGDSNLIIYLVDKRNEARPLKNDDTVKPGDRLVFHVQAPRRAFVAIAGISQTGNAYLVDHDKTAPWKVEPGPSIQLPVSAQVDDSSDAERLFAVFCNEPNQATGATSFIEELYPLDKTERRDIGEERELKIDGCSVTTALVQKAL